MAITCQKSATHADSGSFNSICTIPVAGIPAGSLIICSSSSSTTTPTSCTVTDSKGNTYASVIAYNALGRSVFLSYCKNCIALVNLDTVTFAFSNIANQEAEVDYATGIDTVAPFDVSSALGSTTAVTAVSSGTTAATGQADELVYGFYRGGTLSVEATGYTNLFTITSQHTAYKVVAATGTQIYNPTQASSAYGAGVATFKGTGAVASFVPYQPWAQAGPLVAQ